MVALETAMKKHHISLDSSSESTSHRHALCASGYSYTASSSSTSIEWLIDSGASYHMAKDKAISGIILGANFSPWAVFRGFSPKNNSPFCIF